MNKGGFSLNRFLGISAAKSRIARQTGIPFTKNGRRLKASKGGFLALIFMIIFKEL